MYVGPKKVDELDLNPTGPKKGKKTPNLATIRTNDRAILQKLKLTIYMSRSKKVSELDSNPKNSPAGPKKG